MNGIELWTGLPGSGRGDAALERALAIAEQGGEVWWLVDSTRRVERMERRLLARAGGGVAGIEVVAAAGAARQLLLRAGARAAAVENDVRSLVLGEMLLQREEQGGLPVEPTPGWVRRTGEFFARLEALGADRPEGKRLTRDLERRYPWIGGVLEEYRRLLEERGLVDEASLARVARRLLEAGRVALPELLVVDRLGPQPPNTLALVRGLAQQCRAALVLVDHVEDGGPALSLAACDREGWLELEGVVERAFGVAPAAGVLARRLFALGGGGGAEPMPERQVELAHHPDMAAEVRSVAARIARLIHDEGVDPAQIAVVTTELGEYAPHVEELFPRYGIRGDLRLGVGLATSPAARVAVSLLELRARGLERERVTELLLNPYVRWGTHLGHGPRTLAFDSAARRARIAEGGGDIEAEWVAPLLEEVERLRGRALEGQGEEEDALAAARRRRDLREADAIEEALGELRGFAAAVEALPDPCTVEEALEWVEGMVRRLGVRDRVQAVGRENPQWGQRDVRALGHVQLTLRHVARALRVLDRERWPVRRFAELLQLGIASARLAPPRRLSGGIPVTGPLELRGLRTRHLFLLGLTAEAWPRRPALDLADPGSGRWTDVDRLAESRALTLEALLACDELHLSTPCPPRGEGRDAPSPLLADLQEAGVGLDVVEHRRDPDATVHSSLDLLPSLGEGAGRGGAAAEAALRRATAARTEVGEAGPVDYAAAWRALSVERKRLDPTTLTAWEGMLTGTESARWAAEGQLGRPLSASRLDRYAQCPMKFFLGNVLGVVPLEDVEEEVEARVVGGIVHEILAAAVRELRRRRGGPPVLEEGDEEAVALLLELAEEELGRYPYDDLFWDRIRQSILGGLAEEDDSEGHLLRFLRDHGERLAGEEIHFAEASFGLPPGEEGEVLLENPIVLRREGDSVELAGRVDRISLLPGKGWRVWDYKVVGSDRSLPTKATVEKGLSFQLPLYLWALESWRDAGHGSEHPLHFAKYYIFLPDEVKSGSRGWTLKNHQDNGDALRDRVFSIRDAVAAGRYHHPLSQDKELCTEDYDYNYCPFKDVCRRDHDLWAKRPAGLGAAELEKAYTLAFQHFAAFEDEGGQT